MNTNLSIYHIFIKIFVMRIRGGKISNIRKVMFFSVVFMVFLLMGSVSAIDYNITADDTSLLNENNKIVFSSQSLEVSSYDSISETRSHDDNITITSSEEGELLTSQYISDDNTVVASKMATSLIGNDTELYFKNGTAFKVELSDSDGSLLANQSVIFNINNVNYTRTTNNEGIASIGINLIPGEYKISSFYAGTSDYVSSSITNVVKVLSTISGEDIEKYYRNDTQFYVTLINGQGNLLNNTTVIFNINGVFYERKTNENGTARLNINLNAGEYFITTTNTVNGETKGNNVTVLSTVNGNDVVKYYKNDTQYYATFLDNVGKPLANTNVSFNINGVLYNRTTNASGIAKMNINLYPNNYTITAINPINNEGHGNYIEVLPTMSADDLTMNYRNGRFAVNVVDDVGNPLANTNVTFNINGVFYNRTSDDDGNAYLNINLNVGQYIITSMDYRGLYISNNITVNKANTTITGKNAHVIISIPRNYTVHLMGENNRTVEGEIVHFKYANYTVDAVTDKNGKASIALNNLSIGSYSIEYWFDGNINYYPSASSSKLIVANSTVIVYGEDLDMVYHDGSRFDVKLTDLSGKPLSNRTIAFNINNVDYNRTTNDEGIASIAINLVPGTYTITYTYSKIDEMDYYQGSNTIVVNKLYAKLIAEDVFMEFGDDGNFIAKLVDINNTPVSDVIINMSINGVDYSRVTNKSGEAKLHIGLITGYYPIVTSIDNGFYSAKSITNHVLVNGTIFEADDIDVIIGTAGEFHAALFNAYHKPIVGANITFYYNDITTWAITNSNGVASINIENLNAKGTYPIVFSYENNSGMAYIHVKGTISINDLISAANYVNGYIEANAALPDVVQVGDDIFTNAEYLYLLSEAIVSINMGDLSDLYILGTINSPSDPGAAADMGNFNDFVNLANNLLLIMGSGNTPNSVDTNIGTIGYDGVVYAFTRVIVYYGLTNQLPGTVSIKSLKLYEPQSVLDNENTITDLSPYLSSSTNCQVTNEAIVNLARSLTASCTNAYDKAVAIYNYVRDEISYSFYYDTHYGAVGTLNAGTGNCVDQAHLSIALYRAAGLPARYVHGTCSFSSGGVYGHVWVQVLLGDTWVVSDSTSNRNSFDNVVNWNNYNYDLHGYYSSISF